MVCNVYWNQEKKHSFEDYNFILPDISIGNVGQLTVDLLLNNLTTEHLGRIVHSCFFPFIGRDPFNHESKGLASSCEIYECKEKKLVILQIRSRVFPSKVREFKDLIFNFIKELKFKQIVVIASGTSAYFPAEQLQGIPLHYLTTSCFQNKEVFTQLKFKEFSFPINVEVTDKTRIPGSFISHSLLKNCERENIPLVTLICICSEGNNYPEAFQTVNNLNSWLKLKTVQNEEEAWEIPISWNLPFGSAAPHTLY